MRIRLLVSRSGINFTQNNGDEIDVTIAEGKSLIEAGQAELVRQAEPETAITRKPKAEKAVK